MKTTLLLIGAALLCSCSLPGPGGSTINTTYHPAGLPCGYPEGFLTNVRPADPATVVRAEK